MVGIIPKKIDRILCELQNPRIQYTPRDTCLSQLKPVNRLAQRSYEQLFHWERRELIDTPGYGGRLAFGWKFGLGRL